MQLDDQLRRFFGSADLETLSPDGLQAGIEKMLVELGMEKDRQRRFALWTLLTMFDAAPDLDVAFDNEDDRNSARDLLDMMARASGE
jgi:hypothetical protein